jgi:hypothetical protein
VGGVCEEKQKVTTEWEEQKVTTELEEQKVTMEWEEQKVTIEWEKLVRKSRRLLQSGRSRRLPWSGGGVCEYKQKIATEFLENSRRSLTHSSNSLMSGDTKEWEEFAFPMTYFSSLRFQLREEGKKKLEEEKKRLKRDKLLLEKAQRELQNAIKGWQGTVFHFVAYVPDPRTAFFFGDSVSLKPVKLIKFALFSFVPIGYRSCCKDYNVVLVEIWMVCKILAIISNNLVVPNQ